MLRAAVALLCGFAFSTMRRIPWGLSGNIQVDFRPTAGR